MDFFHSSDDAVRQLGAINRAWNKIEEHLLELEEFWPKVSTQYFGAKTTIERADTKHWQMDGSVLSKRFSVVAVPCAVKSGDQEITLAQLVISVANPADETLVTVGQAFIDRDGLIHSSPNEVVFTHHDSAPNFKLLASILHQVLKAKVI